MATKPGWTGRVFEDFTVGDVYEHPLGRTILDADNIWFTCLTMNTNPIHFDGEYAARTKFKKRLVNSCFTLSLVSVPAPMDLTMHARAHRAWRDLQRPPAAARGHPIPPTSPALQPRRSQSPPPGDAAGRHDDGIAQWLLPLRPPARVLGVRRWQVISRAGGAKDPAVAVVRRLAAAVGPPCVGDPGFRRAGVLEPDDVGFGRQ